MGYSKAPVSAPAGRSKTILCADDEPALLEPVRALLASMNYRVVTAADGETALALARAERPDLMILDVRMPRRDGFGVLEELARSDLAGTPVVMLTGEKSDESVQTGYAKGAVYYVTKPFRADRIRNIVRYLLEDLSEAERRRIETEL